MLYKRSKKKKKCNLDNILCNFSPSLTDKRGCKQDFFGEEGDFYGEEGGQSQSNSARNTERITKALQKREALPLTALGTWSRPRTPGGPGAKSRWGSKKRRSGKLWGISEMVGIKMNHFGIFK